MRLATFTLILAAALATAAPALAQMMTAAPIPNGMGSSTSDNSVSGPIVSKFYVKKVTALSYKILETRVEDGGQLTPEHLAGLQRELDQLNRQYGVRTSLRVRAA